LKLGAISHVARGIVTITQAILQVTGRAKEVGIDSSRLQNLQKPSS